MNDQNVIFMRHALRLSESARLLSPPNPWVGCVIVKDGIVISEGCTQQPGHGHAETQALCAAQSHARGATLYVTLEPCSHSGLTPPCTDAIIKAGIREVYVGIQDPDERVQNRGITQLRKNGIRVIEGICAEEIKQSLAAYLYQRSTKLPYTILKISMTVDGRSAAADGTSKWISSVEARENVHLHRAYSQAIIIGAGTALSDMPMLTARHTSAIPIHQPIRVLLDARGRVPAKGHLFDKHLANTLVFTTPQAPVQRIQEWHAAGAEVQIVSPSITGVDLSEVWQILGARHIVQAFVEGGSILHSALLNTNLWNCFLVYISPLLLGPSAEPIYQNHIATLSAAPCLSLQNIQRFGASVCLTYVKSPLTPAT